MTVPITPVSRLGTLVGQPIVVSSAFLVGPLTPFALSCRSGTVRGVVEVEYSAARGAAEPTRVAQLLGTLRLYHLPTPEQSASMLDAVPAGLESRGPARP